MTAQPDKTAPTYSGAAPAVVRHIRCSWKGCGVCEECKIRAMVRRIVARHGEALRRLADDD